MSMRSLSLASRPVIEVDNQERQELAAQLVSLEIFEDIEGMRRAELRFGAWGMTEAGSLGLVNLDRRVLEFGKAIKIRLGDELLFHGLIGAIEAEFAEAAPPVVILLAEDRLQALRMTRRTRVFEQSSDADVARRVAADHGLTPDIDWPGPTHAVLAQLNRSDLAFLRDRARATGAELSVEDTKLRARLRRAGSALELVQGARLRQCSVTADLAGQRSAVIVTGWDVAAKQAISVEAGPAALGAELGSLEGGSAVLDRAFARRRETLAHIQPSTTVEARAMGEAAYRRMARRFVIARGEADRDAAIRPGATLALRGLGPLFEGEYHCTEVTHRFEQTRGFRTSFVAERPGIGRTA